jgi:GT2 family glycosyltransferase
LARSETVAEIGKLDEDYFFYSEEVDWCFRMKKKGWKVWYLSNAEIYHLGGGSAKRSSLTQMGLLYKNKIHFFRKFHGPLQATLLRYGLALAYSLGLLRYLLLFSRMNKEKFADRVQVRVQLVRCLLLNKFPEIPN